MTITEIQAALSKLGHDPGPIDGAWGRKTIAAVKAFQGANNLAADGIAGPVTVAALEQALKQIGAAVPAPTKDFTLPWVAELLRKRGLHEKTNNAALKKYLKSDGRTLGDPSKLPWCGDLVETILGLTLPAETLVVNPYLARNWLKFGVSVAPIFGAVGVFWRGSKTGTSGHVGILLGLNKAKTHYRVGGGNQSDAISDSALLAKNRLLGARWPTTFPVVRTPLTSAPGGVVSTNEA